MQSECAQCGDKEDEQPEIAYFCGFHRAYLCKAHYHRICASSLGCVWGITTNSVEQSLRAKSTYDLQINTLAVHQLLSSYTVNNGVALKVLNAWAPNHGIGSKKRSTRSLTESTTSGSSSSSSSSTSSGDLKLILPCQSRKGTVICQNLDASAMCSACSLLLCDQCVSRHQGFKQCRVISGGDLHAAFEQLRARLAMAQHKAVISDLDMGALCMALKLI